MSFNKLIERLNKRVSSGKIQLLCEIEITDKEYENLLECVIKKVNNIRRKTNASVDILLSVAMVQIGIREYCEGNYWEYFNNTLGIDLNQNKHSYLGCIFLNTLEKYGLFIYKIEDNNSKRYVQNILIHGFVPNNYIMRFFDFSYSFYDRNLFRKLSEDLEEELDELSIFMQNTLNSEKDSIILAQSKKRPTKTYKLLKCTRNVLADENLDSARKIFQNILSLIDKYFYDSRLPKDESRTSIKFNGWVENQTCFHQNKRKKRNRSTGSRLISNRPYLKLNFKKLRIELVIPEQKFREKDFSDNIMATRIINGSKTDCELETYNAFGAFVSEESVPPARVCGMKSKIC